MIKPIPERNILLEFVPALTKVQEKKPDAPPTLISEKNTAAQNPIIKPDLPKGEAYQQGITDHPALQRSSLASPFIPFSQAQLLSDDFTPKETPSPVEILKTEKTAASKKDISLEKKKEKEGKDSRKTRKIREKMDDLPLPSLSPSQPRTKTDDFDSPAKRNLTTTAEILEEYSYNTKSHAVARYFSKESKKIINVWQLEVYSSQELASSFAFDLKRTVVVFQIMPDGHIEDLHVIEHEGRELAQRYPIFAIEKTAPFTPLPEDVLSYIRTKGLWIKIEFNYTSEKKKNKK
jgi:hypothetical protein